MLKAAEDRLSSVRESLGAAAKALAGKFKKPAKGFDVDNQVESEKV